MGEAQVNLFEPEFNRSIKVQATDQRLTSNAGVILLRDAEHRLGLIDSIAKNILDPRDPRRIRYATIDIDSFPIEVHGNQHGAKYNGYYRKTVYHLLVASLSVGGDYDGNREGQRLGNGFIHAALRQGQVHTANGYAAIRR